MVKNEQDNKSDGKKRRVKHVLDYHNKKYGTHIDIRGKTQDIYPELKGKSDWDWVCYDTETDDECAVEVKEITKEQVEVKSEGIYKLLHEVREHLQNKLPGSFSLFVAIDSDYDFPFKKQAKNKQLFKKALSKAIMVTAHRLDAEQKEDITSQISEEIPFELPPTIFFDLYRSNDKNSILVIERLVGISSSKLENFEHLVSHANEQLKKAEAEETFLVLIEEGYNPTDPPKIEEALKSIDASSYSEIRHVYFIRGEEVAEIPLPIP